MIPLAFSNNAVRKCNFLLTMFVRLKGRNGDVANGNTKRIYVYATISISSGFLTFPKHLCIYMSIDGFVRFIGRTKGRLVFPVKCAVSVCVRVEFPSNGLKYGEI